MSNASWENYGAYEDSIYPELWDGIVYAAAPCLGPTGTLLFDHGPYVGSATATGVDPATAWTLSEGRYCLDFNANGQYFRTTGNVPSMTDLTFSVWTRARNPADGNRVIDCTDTSTGFVIYWGLRGSTYVPVAILVGASSYRDDENFDYTRWHCITAVRRNGVLRCYVDGSNELSADASVSTPTVAGDMLVMCARNLFTTTDGQVDDIRVYDRALSDDEIRLLASSRGVAYQSRSRRVLYSIGVNDPSITGTASPTLGAATSKAYGSHIAFPKIETTSSGNSGANATAHTVTLPTGIVAGDLLVVAFVNDGAATASVTTPTTGWSSTSGGTAPGNAARTRVFYRTADGNEASTITVTTGSSEGTAYACYRISGSGGAFEAATTASTGTSTAPDPPSFDPTWDVERTLWIAYTGWDTNVSATAYPTNYSLSQITNVWANAQGCGVAMAARQNEVASEDPGTFTLSSSEDWVANTLAVRPVVVIYGSAANTLGGATSSASGYVPFFGEIAATLGNATSTVTSSQTFTGTSTNALAAATSTVTASQTFTGTSTNSLALATATVSGSLTFTGTSTQTLGAATATAIGATPHIGPISATLGAATATAIGFVNGFPTIQTTSTGNSGSSATTHTVTLPTGIAANDLLLVAFSNDGTATASVTTPASGWSQVFTQNAQAADNQAQLTVFQRTANGSEASTITVTTTASEASAYACYRISNAAALEAGTATSGSSTTPDPPALNPAGWDIERALWIAVCGWDANVSLSTYPTSYTLNQLTDRWANTNGSGIAIAARNNEVDSEDPGAFALASTEQWAANTLAVRPYVIVFGTSTTTLGAATATASGSAGSDGTFGTVSASLANATGSATGAETFDATSTVSTANATSTITASQTFTGTIAASLADATVTANGSHTFTGTSTQSLANATGTASGDLTFSGSSAPTLAAATSTASGTVESTGVTGSITASLAAATATATGSMDFTGTSTPTAGPVTSTATGSLTFSGTSTQSLANATATASGSSLDAVTGTIAAALAAATATAAGAETFSGTIARSLSDATSTAAGSQAFTGTIAQSLSAATSTATGSLSFSGTITPTLGLATSSASGTQTFTGTTTTTLVAATSNAIGFTGDGIQGVVSVTLGAATATATGSTPYIGPIDATLSTATSAASGLQTFTGTSTQSLSAATGSLAGAQTFTGTITRSLGNATSTALGAETFTGTSAPTLSAATATASGFSGDDRTGTVAATLGNATSSAVGITAYFPSIATTSSGNSAASVTDHTVTLPTGIVAGDLILVAFCNDGTATASVVTPASGWSETFTSLTDTSQARLTVFQRIADGLEAATITVRMSASATEGGAWACYRISGSSGVVAAGTATTGSSTSPDPPSLNPATWDIEKTLWIAVCGWDGNAALSAYPTSYSLNQLTNRWANTQGSGVGIAARQNEVASEDPGAFTIATEQWAANTLAVRPLVYVYGPAASTLGNATSTALGAVPYSGTIASTLGAATGTASGTVASNEITGAIATALGNATSTATGAETFTGTSTQSLSNATSTIAASQTFTGTIVRSLGNATSTALGAQTFSGTSTTSLTAATSTASGTTQSASSITSTLQPATGTASGSQTFTGTSARTLGAATATASGAIDFASVAAGIAGPATASATGAQIFTGTIAVTRSSATALITGYVALFDQPVDVTATGRVRSSDLTAKTKSSSYNAKRVQK